MPSTIKDIKTETGLSLATISKYLNGGNVLPKNKEKIEAAIKKLNYQVNEIARGLVTNTTRTVGVSVFDVTDVFTGAILHDIGMQLSKLKYGMLIVYADNDHEREEKNIDENFISSIRSLRHLSHNLNLFLFGNFNSIEPESFDILIIKLSKDDFISESFK